MGGKQPSFSVEVSISAVGVGDHQPGPAQFRSRRLRIPTPREAVGGHAGGDHHGRGR
jgi:hypothetical protein